MGRNMFLAWGCLAAAGWAFAQSETAPEDLVLKRAPVAEYPEPAKALEATATVVAEVRLNADGSVASASVRSTHVIRRLPGSGIGEETLLRLFSEPALLAARTAVFDNTARLPRVLEIVFHFHDDKVTATFRIPARTRTPGFPARLP